jgi:DNA topoisomerase VI subunit B
MPKRSAAHDEAAPALIVPENFIQATRDSGYKTLGSALAELIDNAFEAQATIVSVAIGTFSEAETYDTQVVVSDNGRGMDGNTLAHALQFGWSSRFNQRNGHGRYGMGLPNSSLSHAGRVEVYSARSGKTPASVFLDVDDVASGRSAGILCPKSISRSAFRELSPFGFGTVVVWATLSQTSH